MNTQNIGDEIPQRAVSIFGQNEAMDDFPVLKAFQQYIDAEQVKARKRILGLGIFFGVVLALVITVFIFLLHGINARNQALSDRLIEYAMQESSRRQTAAPQPTAQDAAALKSVTETLAAIQQKLQSSDAKPIAYDDEHARKIKEDTAKIERAKRLLAQEKQRLANEKERLHQIEIEHQRRKLYPDLYDEYGEPTYRRRTTSPSSRANATTLTDDDIREIIRETYDEEREVRKAPAAARSEKVESEQDDELDNAIEYFKDDDYTIPVNIKGSSSKVKFTVPVD